MATIDELSRGYVQRILAAVARDGFTEYSNITTASLYQSEILTELKGINQEIEKLVYADSDKPLSPADKIKIKDKVKQILRPRSPEKIGLIFESASNDALTNLADAIENILKGAKK